MPRFSVIIPAYNRERLIADTLASVLAQSGGPAGGGSADRRDIEVIVVDDGSKDSTRDVVRGFGERVTLLEQANKGPGAARNLGLRAASGDYICFLDSDDLWFPWTAEAYWQAIETHNRPAFLTGKPLVFTEPVQVTSAFADRAEVAAFPDYLSTSSEWAWFSASSFVMRADALRAVGGMCDRWVNCEDADLALRLGVSPGFVTFRKPCTFAWRSHSGSAMSAIRKTFEGYQFLLDNESAGRYPGGPARRAQRREIIARHVRYGALLCLDARPPLLGEGLTLYRRTLAWNLALGRLKFAAGFPLRAIASTLGGSAGAGPPPAPPSSGPTHAPGATTA